MSLQPLFAEAEGSESATKPLCLFFYAKGLKRQPHVIDRSDDHAKKRGPDIELVMTEKIIQHPGDAKIAERAAGKDQQ